VPAVWIVVQVDVGGLVLADGPHDDLVFVETSVRFLLVDDKDNLTLGMGMAEKNVRFFTILRLV
jgi:hypothetical protein